MLRAGFGVCIASLLSNGCPSNSSGTQATPSVLPVGRSQPAMTSSAPSKPKTHCYIGILTKNVPRAHGDTKDYCADDIHYQGANYRLGRINVFGLKSRRSAGYIHLEATRHDNLLRALKVQGKCPEASPFPIQARSDWDHEDGGYFTTKDRLRRASYFRAVSAKDLELVEVEAPKFSSKGIKRGGQPRDPGAQISLRLNNPLSFGWSGLKVVVHYEGGKGKPMPVYVEHNLPPLAPGVGATHRYPAAVQRGAAWYHFASVSLEGQSGGCEFVSSTNRR